MTFSSTDPQGHEGNTNTWYTPKWIIDGLGLFDLDPCTNSTRPYSTAIKCIEHDKGECGLSASWTGRVWLNPPYGKELPIWLDKFSNHKWGVALVFARMGNVGIQDCIKSGAHFFFFRKRVKFMNEQGILADKNPGADSCLMFFTNTDKHLIERAGFDGVFL